jgi:hypothetical protein
MTSIEIKGGWFHQILAPSVQQGEFTFVPVLGDLGGALEIAPYRSDEQLSRYPLSDYLMGRPLRILEEVQDLFEDSIDALWVRARIPAIFGSDFLVSPAIPDYKYRLIEQTFMACELQSKDEWVAYPFICEDHNLCAGLRFNPDDALTSVYGRIARAFWQLLLDEIECVYEFSAGYLHYNELDDEEWHRIALKRGQFKMGASAPMLWL